MIFCCFYRCTKNVLIPEPPSPSTLQEALHVHFSNNNSVRSFCCVLQLNCGFICEEVFIGLASYLCAWQREGTPGNYCLLSQVITYSRNPPSTITSFHCKCLTTYDGYLQCQYQLLSCCILHSQAARLSRSLSQKMQLLSIQAVCDRKISSRGEERVVSKPSYS